MSWSRRVSCLAASLAFFASACRGAPALQVLGDSSRLPSDEHSPVSSPFFDGHRVHLRAARGETLGVEVRVTDGRTHAVSLDLSSAPARVQAFRVRSVEVKAASTDLYGASTGPGRYPDALFPETAPVRTTELAFFDVSVDSNAPKGTYSGVLRVDERQIPVVLAVSRARIDVEAEPLVWVFYAPRELARVHGLPDGDEPSLIDREAEYYALFRAHGALLASDLPPARFDARRGFVRDVKYWPVALDLTSDETITRDVKAWLERFKGTGVTPFVIPIDEPRTDAARRRARHIADVIGSAGGGRPWLLRAVTDAPNPVYGDAIDLYFSPKGLPAPAERRARGERFFTYNGRSPEAGSMILDTEGSALRSWGWIAERYGVDLWYAWEGLYFSDRYNDGRPTDVMVDPVTFDERTRGGTDFGNGDGLLAYPGAFPSLRLKTLRRGLEDRLLLRELARCDAKAKDDVVHEVVPRALGEAGKHQSFPKDERGWEAARNKVFDLLEARCHD